MRVLLIVTIFLSIAVSACGQFNNIYTTTGIPQTIGPPTFVPSTRGSVVAIDTTTGLWWVNPNRRSGATWIKMGHAMREISGCSAPSGAPTKFQSWLVVNACTDPETYLWNGTTWKQLNAGGGGGTWGSITGTLSNQTDLQAELDAKLSSEVDGSTTNELQNLSLSGQALSISSGTGATLPIVNVTAGYGTAVSIASGNAMVRIDTTLVPSAFGTQSVYKLWPLGDVKSYQPVTAKRNWIIYHNNIQSASTRNAFVKFDTITNGIGSTTNVSGNGIWMGTSSSVADMLSGFSNHINHGGGFNLMGSGTINFTDWRAAGTRGSVLKCLNWTDGVGDGAISFFKTTSALPSLGKVAAGSEIGAIRFAAADTTRALKSTDPFEYPKPSSAIVGYVFGKPFNNAYYGGIGIWTTNGSTTQIRAVAIDSTFSTTVRAGINCIPSRANALEVAGNVSLTTAGNKLKIATGTNASAGTATLVAGEVTINTTAVTTNSIIMVKTRTVIVVQGNLSTPQGNIVNGTSFKILSSNMADVSTVDWWIIN